MKKLAEIILMLTMAFNLTACTATELQAVIKQACILTDGTGQYYAFFRDQNGKVVEMFYHAGEIQYISRTTVEIVEENMRQFVNNGWYLQPASTLPAKVVESLSFRLLLAPATFLNMPFMVLPVMPGMFENILPAPVRVDA